MRVDGARQSLWTGRSSLLWGDATQLLGAPGTKLALVLLGGSFLRFLGLSSESIWLDEATSIIIARMNLSSVVAWAAGDIHPPLYYLALHFWLRLGDSEFATRALSAVFGVVTIAVVYALATELANQRVGMLSALLFALSPLHIGYSQEARMYVMVTTLSLLGSYLMLLAARGQRVTHWVGYVLCTAMALYTHYFALFVLMFQMVFMVLWLWRARAERTLWMKWLLAGAVIALIFLPWVPVLYHQATTGGGGWVERSVGRPSWRALLDTWVQFSIGLDANLYPRLLRRAAYALFALCLLFSLTELLRARTATREHENGHSLQELGVLFCLLYAGLPLLMVWLLSQVKPMYTVRYLLPFLPGYCMLVAQGVQSMRWKGARIAAAALLALVSLSGVWLGWRTLSNPDWRSAAGYIVARAMPGDVVLLSPRWNEKPFDYYARGRVTINMDLPIPVTERSAQQVIADVERDYRRVWLFWERGHYSDPDGTANRILQSRFKLLETSDFRGVRSLFLYDLTSTKG
jgi:mannosyltransferase